MSNFSNAYKMYLLGYVGEVGGQVREMISERQAQALALGVHHRTTSKPPLMSSVAVTAELRAMMAPFCDVVLLTIPHTNVIGAIKAVREANGSGLKAAKDLVDRVRGEYRGDAVYIRPEDRPAPAPAQPQIVLAKVTRERGLAAAKLLRDAGCTVEVS